MTAQRSSSAGSAGRTTKKPARHCDYYIIILALIIGSLVVAGGCLVLTQAIIQEARQHDFPYIGSLMIAAGLLCMSSGSTWHREMLFEHYMKDK